jgi:methylenetetrahydrofolate dehydrogenase (NADP+)/methenyltetrahydrofolate cyclohydrolase
MPATLLSGRELADQIITQKLIPNVQDLQNKNIKPKLVVLLVGKNPASESYIRQKEKLAAKSHIISEVRRFDASLSEEQLLSEIIKINTDDSIHGVIVQLPLPPHISVTRVLQTIDPQKDVDGFTPFNVGKLLLGEPTLESCTPKGILTLLESTGEPLAGKKAVVVGRSNIVGKPVSALLIQKGATVTVCHSQTQNLQAEIAHADILIVAIGQAEFIQGEWIPFGCIVIDVGMNTKEDGTLCGDVHFESAQEKASFLTPVPGGVGPMTVVSLLENTLQAAKNQSIH